jgi:hypothetical protein
MERPRVRSRIHPALWTRRPLLLTTLTAIALSASTVLAPPSGRAGAGEPFIDAGPVVAVSVRPVCTLFSNPATSAGIIGLDSADSLQVNGTTYWTFGDTTLDTGWVIPNSIATSTDMDASDCIDLTPKQANGYAVPMLAQPNGKLTVWPSGMQPTGPGTVGFYYASVVSDPAAAWAVAGVGVGSFDSATLTGTPAFGGTLVWQSDDYLPSHTVSDAGYVYLFLDATRELWTTDTILARVPAAQIASPGAYEYWDASSGAWTSGLWDAAPGSWSPALDSLPPLIRQFGMHNGIDVAYNAFLGKWLAVYTTRFMTSLNARVADSLTGPWSADEAVLIDCARYHQSSAQAPFACYSGAQHEYYQRDGGRTIYVTYSNSESYLVHLREIRLAAAIEQWTNAQGRAVYLPHGATPPPGYTLDGVAFHASDVPLAGLTAVHRWLQPSTGISEYGATSPGSGFFDAGIAFYTPLDLGATQSTNLPYAPVYRWSLGTTSRYSPMNLAPAGYTQGQVAFYAPCPDGDRDGLTNCDESIFKTDPGSADTDGDGLEDAVERSAAGCDPLVVNADDLDGIPAADEVALGTTSPCMWDSGAYGCAHAEWHHPDCDVDTDADGCRDAFELGPDPRLGGRRSPTNPWDLYDANRDGRVAISDILIVVQAYGSSGAKYYTPQKDRSPPPSPAVEPDPSKREVWDLGPPDGTITVTGDIFAITRQFGHSCLPLG